MTSIKDGVKDGSQTLYYQNGQLIRSNNYKNGEFHGVQKKFSKSGVLEELENYKNGKTHGVQELYLEGRISIRSYWTDGELDSDPEFYDKDGNLIIDDWNSLFPEPIQEIPKKVQE
jgi:antitoxin component YwqK of YwqJK toxin-antitoxin module